MEPHAVSWRESLRFFSEVQFIHQSVSGENKGLTDSTLSHEFWDFAARSPIDSDVVPSIQCFPNDVCHQGSAKWPKHTTQP